MAQPFTHRLLALCLCPVINVGSDETAMAVAGQPGEAVGQGVTQPGVDGIGIARLQQAMPRDRMR